MNGDKMFNQTNRIMEITKDNKIYIDDGKILPCGLTPSQLAVLQFLETGWLAREDIDFLAGVYNGTLTRIGDPDFEADVFYELLNIYIPSPSGATEAEVPTTDDPNFLNEVVKQLTDDELWVND